MDKKLILNQIKSYKKISSDAEFARFIGITPQNLHQWYTRNTYDVNKLLMCLPELSPNWLLFGVGDMFNNITDETMTTEDDNIIIDNEYIEVHEIPYISRELARRRDVNIKERVLERDDDLSWRKMVDITGQPNYVQRVITNAMSPLFMPGDVLFIKFLPETANIISGAIYLIDTSTYGTMVRKVYAIDNTHYRLKAINTTYDEIIISNDEVYSISIVDKALRSDFNTPDEVVRVSDMLSEYREMIAQQRKEIDRLHAIIDKLLK